MAQRNTVANGKIVRRTERTCGASSRRRRTTTTTTTTTDGDGDGASPSSSACTASRCISRIIARSHPFPPFPRRGCNRCGFTYSRRTLRDFSLLLGPGIRRSFSFEVARFYERVRVAAASAAAARERCPFSARFDLPPPHRHDYATHRRVQVGSR